MDETYGTYVDDACFDVHYYDDDTNDDADGDTNDYTEDDIDDYTNDDIDDDTDDGGRGNRRRLLGLAVHFSLRGRGCVQISGTWIPSGRGKGRG